MSLKLALVRTTLMFVLCQCDTAGAQPRVSLDSAPAFLPASTRPLVASRELSTNGRNTARLFTLAVEEEGLAHIRALLSAAPIEEQWAYLPAQHVWIEIGIAESGPQVEADVEYLKALLAVSDRVHLYHFHPAQYFEPGLNATLALALPSPADVDGSVKIAKMQHALNPLAEVRNFVVSPYGIVEYEPTPLGRSSMLEEEDNPRGFIERNLLTLVAIRRSEFNVTRTVAAKQSASPLEIIADLCAQLSGEYYDVRFSPL